MTPAERMHQRDQSGKRRRSLFPYRQAFKAGPWTFVPSLPAKRPVVFPKYTLAARIPVCSAAVRLFL